MKAIQKTILGLAIFSYSNFSLASGFQLLEQNALYLGTAYSGTAAWAADASSGWYNAAALTHIKNKQIVASTVFVNNSAEFTASSTNIPFQPGVSVPGPQSDNAHAGGLAAIPALHYAARLSPNLVFGLSIGAPFGLATDYAPDRVMRYVATYSSVATLDFSPSFAYRVVPCLSVGAGLDAIYADASLDAQSTAFTGGDPLLDGYQKNRATDWGLGWHAGVLLELTPCTRVGVNYHSKYDLTLKGVSRQLAPTTPAVPTQSGQFVLRDVRSQVVLPDSVVLSAYHAVNPALAIVADASWTTWSRLQNLDLEFNSLPNDTPPLIRAANTDTPLSFKDTYKLSVGLNYAFNKRWQGRIGTAYDRSPVQGVETRTARLPDADRTWLALGVSYTCNQVSVDLGYAHLFIKEANLSDGGPLVAGTQTPLLPFNNVTGKYSSHADLLGVQLRYDFV